MRNILWVIAVICSFIWLLGVTGVIRGLNSGYLVHVLLMIAVIVIFYNILNDSRHLD